MAQTVVALRLVGAIYIVEWTRRRSSALRPSRLSWFFGSIMTANLSGTMRWPNARDFGRLPVAYCAIAAIIPHHHAT